MINLIKHEHEGKLPLFRTKACGLDNAGIVVRMEHIGRVAFVSLMFLYVLRHTYDLTPPDRPFPSSRPTFLRWTTTVVSVTHMERRLPRTSRSTTSLPSSANLLVSASSKDGNALSLRSGNSIPPLCLPLCLLQL